MPGGWKRSTAGRKSLGELADAVSQVMKQKQCPNGAEAMSATLTNEGTTGYLTNTYTATVVCK